jgi:hypothetical protein
MPAAAIMRHQQQHLGTAGPYKVWRKDRGGPQKCASGPRQRLEPVEDVRSCCGGAGSAAVGIDPAGGRLPGGARGYPRGTAAASAGQNSGKIVHKPTAKGFIINALV